MTRSLPIIFAFILLSAISNAEPPNYVPKGFSLQWEPDFTDKSLLKKLDITDSKAWRLSNSKGKPALELIGGSKYNDKVESPRSIALLPDRKFGDFFLEAELLQTSKEYGHRDLCLFFGFQAPGQYYYVHFAPKTDPRANQIFIVNEKPFTKITRQTTAGSRWINDTWHKVRVQRIGSKMKVWFNDMQKPAMLADDKRFGSGFIGFGSYNDSGMFANVRVWAPSATKVEKSGSLFKKK